MDLKLAEYDLEGKFKGFLELGADEGFAYCGHFIFASWLKEEYRFHSNTDRKETYSDYYLSRYDKDQKDPLNRFDGRFNNRSYGEGRFVLIKDDQDNVECVGNLPIAPYYDPPCPEQKYELKEVIFNLHENPEAYKLKSSYNLLKDLSMGYNKTK
jgi:hypothetical protein